MLREHMRIGQLEELLLTPVKPLEYILSWSFLAITLTTVSSLPLILIAVVVNVFHTSIKAYILATFIFLISMIASFGFAFLIFGLTPVVREGDKRVSLLGNAAPLLGGLYFPVTLLPMPLLVLSYAFPFTWGVDLLRAVFLGSKTIPDFKTEMVLLIMMSSVYFGLGGSKL